ncbi:MAG: PEGA domain-containing protein [Deltaproteobacteria bacterium]|nr:PEGA domain-containing protein [Deltaproteobacteria bacterium]
MRDLRFLLISILVISALVTTRAVHADENKIAILPPENLAGISDAQLGYLHDVVRDAAADALSQTNYILVPQDQVEASFRSDPSHLIHCDESCAYSVGKALGAHYVVHATIKHLDRQTVVILKLLDTSNGSLKSMKRIKGNNLIELEEPLGQAVKTILSLEQIEVPSPVPGIPPETPMDSGGDYWGSLLVTAEGVRKHGKDRAPHPIEADVYLNGKKVGVTPYRDGLPEGNYEVMVKRGKISPYVKTIPIVPGRLHRVEAKLIIPMTSEERSAYQREQQEKERIRREQQTAEWREEHDAWEKKALPLRKKRIPMLVSGIVLGITGTGFMIGGGVVETKAQDQNEKINTYHEYWQNSVSTADLDFYSNKIKQYKEWRDRNHALGITYMCIGGAALATSITLFIVLIVTPRVPKEPEPPVGLSVFTPSLRLSPMLGSQTAGAGLTLSF